MEIIYVHYNWERDPDPRALDLHLIINFILYLQVVRLYTIRLYVYKKIYCRLYL
jgi:hypothetical protein